MTVRILLVFAALLPSAVLLVAPVSAQKPTEGVAAEEHRLEPADTSSPRATLFGLIEDGNEAWRACLRSSRRGTVQSRRTGGMNPGQHYLDLSQVPPGQYFDVSLEAGILLLDVLNRIELPDPVDVPDADQMELLKETRWRVPHTPIIIARVEEGPKAGQWLFAPATIENARYYYRRTRHLTLNSGAAIGDGYRIFVAVAGWMIPVA